ncbi:MAG: DUF488 domain-containing protein [Armatimonadota bacterium]|nr:DUF488 domain-containing protein [Armatimonadota bacterium]
MANTQQSGTRIYTIGHSSHTPEEFVRLLRLHEIKLVVDVRSAPYSKYTPQFNKSELEYMLTQAQIGYRYSGQQLGGKPSDESLYTPSGAPDFDGIASRPEFARELEAVIGLAREEAIAIMCSEGEPIMCHRERLLARHLRSMDVEVLHILPDGTLLRQEQGTLF